MTRQELIGSSEYWIIQYSIALYEEVEKWSIGKTHKECANILGVSLYEYRKIKKGNWKGSIKDYTRILLKMGKVSIITIKDVKDIA